MEEWYNYVHLEFMEVFCELIEKYLIVLCICHLIKIQFSLNSHMLNGQLSEQFYENPVVEYAIALISVPICR